MHMELFGKAILKQFSIIFKMYVLHILQNKWGCHLVWELSVLWFVLIAGVVGISPNHEETKMQVYPGSQPYTHLQYSTPSLVPVSQPQPLISLPPSNIPAATMNPRYPISPNMYTRLVYLYVDILLCVSIGNKKLHLIMFICPQFN